MADDTGAPAPEEVVATPGLTITEVAAPPPKKLGFGLKGLGVKFDTTSTTVIKKTGFGYGGVQMTQPKVEAAAAAAAAAAAKPKTVAAVPKPKTAVALPESYSNAAGIFSDGGKAVMEEAEAEAVPDATTEVAAFKEVLKTGRVRVATLPPPEPKFIMPREVFSASNPKTEEEIKTAKEVRAAKGAFKGPKPVEQPTVATFADPANYDIIDPKTKKVIYTPITSPYFSEFMVQAYQQYSPLLLKVLKEGPDSLKERKSDPDACMKRDPNKVENFYYQKLVRDYLSRDTPYRGLLVYHGLGSGKTCTSIAAAEALYWGGKKTIYVLTPATLSNNYRRELGKCGYYPLRQNNFWSFVELDKRETPTKDATGKIKMSDPVFIWATDQGMGLPASIVLSQGGFWFPNPEKESNWDTLSSEAQEAIRVQQKAHLNHRFKFIHYNGVMPNVLAQLAMEGIAEGKSMFDDAVVIVDEIHNLVRTINGTTIGGKPISRVMETDEPREFTWSAPIGRARPGFRYPRGYTLYRLLQNAVGAKIIALSATPMINYAQEMAILMNIIGGEQRVVEIPLKAMNKGVALSAIEEWAKRNPEIDFYSVEQAADKSTVLVLTPVPFGFSKVVTKTFETRGFVRMDAAVDVKTSRERNMDTWAVSVLESLEAAGILPGTVSTEAKAALATAKGTGKPLATETFRLKTFPMLPDDATEFVDNFVDRSTLGILNANVLKARCNGLISYYRGGSEDLMPRELERKVVEIPMSEMMFKEYTRARAAELEMEGVVEPDEGAAAAAAKPVKGISRAEQDLYAQATKTQQTGFLALSRAACNWVFPPEVPRPKMTIKQQTQLLGIEPERTIAADLVVDADLDSAPAPPEEGSAEASEAVIKDEVVAEAAAAPADAALAGVVTGLLSGLEANADAYLNKGLAAYSPKYAAMLDIIRSTPGPSLVYSQFKTLEGLGIFAAALRAADEKFVQLDIEKDATGQWTIPDATMAELDRPRYILYTGDQDLEKRRLLLQLYNADVKGLPPTLKGQCEALLGTEEDNRNGRICRVFMITQSGAEGISLFNTRAVLIMEPYWNNVRLQQVIGRAIRLCSHMKLPQKDRTVSIFTFLATFTDEQKATGAKQIMMSDKQMTTDQMIYAIAQNKQKLADGLMEVAQTAAMDCQLHYHEHGAVTKCFQYEKGARPLFMYHPDWHRDIQAMSGVRAV
jgi:hypothetical protein